MSLKNKKYIFNIFFIEKKNAVILKLIDYKSWIFFKKISYGSSRPPYTPYTGVPGVAQFLRVEISPKGRQTHAMFNF